MLTCYKLYKGVHMPENQEESLYYLKHSIAQTIIIVLLFIIVYISECIYKHQRRYIAFNFFFFFILSDIYVYDFKKIVWHLITKFHSSSSSLLYVVEKFISLSLSFFPHFSTIYFSIFHLRFIWCFRNKIHLRRNFNDD